MANNIYRPPYSMTNKGLRIEPLSRRDESGDFQVPLNCKRLGTDWPLEIWLRAESGKFVRTRMSKLWPFEEQAPVQPGIEKPGVEMQPATPQLKRNVFYVLPARLSVSSRLSV